jgi:hypothetical protein
VGTETKTKRRPVSHLVSFPEESLSLSSISFDLTSHLRLVTASKIWSFENEIGTFPMIILVTGLSLSAESESEIEWEDGVTRKGFLSLTVTL